MKGYLEEALADYRMDIKREATTPAREDLFDIKPNSIPLEKPKVEVFHSIAAKLLYESTRECIDLLLAIAFLCTCASRRSTKQGQAKLKRVHEYVKSTIDLECTIGTNDIGRRRTWVDASFRCARVHEEPHWWRGILQALRAYVQVPQADPQC